MLIGEYIHTVDSKNRISLPAKFRKELGKKVVLTHGLDGCLFIYSLSEWKKISEKLSEMGMAQADSRGFNRFILAGAVELEIDSLGRINIPDFLKSFAEIGQKAVFAGVYKRVEVWNEKKWSLYKSRMEKQADVMAEKLGETGML